ncbi:uncharacterized protein METZ01_LOCUS502420, partial [marine metagenome]
GAAGIPLQRRSRGLLRRRGAGPHPPAGKPVRQLRPGTLRGLHPRQEQGHRRTAATHRPAAPEHRADLGVAAVAGAGRRRTRRLAAPRAGGRTLHRRLHHPRRQPRLQLRPRREPLAGLRQGHQPDQPDRALRQFDPARPGAGGGTRHRGGGEGGVL